LGTSVDLYQRSKWLWSYGPAEIRYGHGGTTVWEGTTVRSKSAVREKTEGPSKDVDGGTTIRRSTPEKGSKSGGEIKGGAQMQKNTAPAGGGKAEGGAQGGTKQGGGGEAVTPALPAPINKKRPPKRPLCSGASPDGARIAR
jgi:hypothetical protein